MVVYAVWDRVVRVRFPAPRLSLKGYEMSKRPEIWEISLAPKEVWSGSCEAALTRFSPVLPDK